MINKKLLLPMVTLSLGMLLVGCAGKTGDEDEFTYGVLNSGIIKSVSDVVEYKNQINSYSGIDACNQKVSGETGMDSSMIFTDHGYHITLNYLKEDEKPLGFENYMKRANISNAKKLKEYKEQTRFEGKMCGKTIKGVYTLEENTLSSDEEYIKLYINLEG